LDDQKFAEALEQLAQLQVDVDEFFEDILVMVEDPVVRNNRLALLAQLQGLFRRVADISYLR
jgi:glycyl-tRNA synthetase beta chain